MLIMSLVGGVFIPHCNVLLTCRKTVPLWQQQQLYYILLFHAHLRCVIMRSNWSCWQADVVIWNEYSVCVIGNQVLNSSGSPRWLLTGPPQQLFGNVLEITCLQMSFFPNDLGWNWTHRCDSVCETHVTLTDDLADLENYSCLVPVENKVTQVIY